MKQERIKDKIIYFVSVLAMCALLVSMAYFFFLRTVEIDLTKNIRVYYSGENGSAMMEVEVVKDDLNQRMQEFLDTVRFEVTPNTNLSNGDVVTITAAYDDDLAQRYHYEITNTSMEWTVEGLQDRYGSLADVDSDYLHKILQAGQDYVSHHQEEIFGMNVSQTEEDWNLDSIEVRYAAFLKAHTSASSDRVIQICQLNYVQNDQTMSLYYLVCVPEVNDGKQIQTQDIFGEKAYLTEQEVAEEAYAQYVQRVFGSQYQIETISLPDEKESE